jgi:hypothetical protein
MTQSIFTPLTIAYMLFCSMDDLRSVSRPTAYTGLSLRQQLWMLWYVDHPGRHALLKFWGMSVAFFLYPSFKMF